VPTPYASFGLWSRRMPASDMSAVLGLEPDEITVRAVDLVDPPVPASHEWMVTCRDPEKTVDEQVEDLVQRLAPYTAQIAQLAAHLEQDECGGARLHIVRQVNTPTAFMSDSSWRLKRQVLQFLHVTNADLNVDEIPA
jgi:Domain of unknown function (DUF4279)